MLRDAHHHHLSLVEKVAGIGDRLSAKIGRILLIGEEKSSPWANAFCQKVN
jgi:hypothetical protein